MNKSTQFRKLLIVTFGGAAAAVLGGYLLFFLPPEMLRKTVGRVFDQVDDFDLLSGAETSQFLHSLKLGAEDESVAEIRRRAEDGDADEQMRLAMAYYLGLVRDKDGRDLPADREASSKWFRMAAENGDGGAQFYMALMYETGDGLNKDGRRARHWYRTAAQQGVSSAKYSIGKGISEGRWPIEDSFDREMLEWYNGQVEEARRLQQAAEKGDPVAQYQYSGKFSNTEDKLPWLQRSAAGGYVPAQDDLGTMYYLGSDIQKNIDLAIHWLEKAAAKGHPLSQHRLGNILSREFQTRFHEAILWYRRSAEQGAILAQLRLASVYKNGDGVPKDFVIAYMWYNLAGSACSNCPGRLFPDGLSSAKEDRDNLEELMSPEQIEKAQSLTRQWLARKSE